MATLRPPPPGRRGRGARPTPVASRPLSSAPLPEASAGLAAPSAAENAALSARADASSARDEPRGGFQAARALFDGKQQRTAPSAPAVVTSVAAPVPEVEASSAAKEEPPRAASVRALISKLNSPAAAHKAAEKPAVSPRFAPRAAAPIAAVSQPAFKSPVEPPRGPRSPVQNAKALFEVRSQPRPGPASTPTTRPATANSPVAAVSQRVAPAHTPRSPVQNAKAVFETRAQPLPTSTPTPVTTQATTASPVAAVNQQVSTAHTQRSPVQNAKAVFETRAQPPPTSTPTPVTTQATTASPVAAINQQVSTAHVSRSPVQNAKAVFEASRSPVQAAKAAFEARDDNKSPAVPVPAQRSSVQAAKAMFEARAEAPPAPPARMSTPVARPPAPHTPAPELAATAPVVAERAVPVPTPQSPVQAAKALFESPAAPNPAPTPAPAPVPVVVTSMPVPVPVEPSPPSPAAWTSEVHPPSAHTLPSSPVMLPSDLPEFHPFKLLLPVTTVPVVPRSVDCVYDDAAIEVQKSITKVAKKVFKKNKPRFEEFKVNARLFGSGFMDADEYLQSLITDFKPLRALQLVPCLASIQPDAVKRQNLLFAARGYRLRNLDTLTSQCDSVDTQPTLVRSLSTDSTVSTVSTVSVASNAPIEPAPALAQTPAEPSPAQGQPPAGSVPMQLEAPVEPLPVKSEAPIEFMAVPIESSAMAVPMSLPTPVEYEVVTKGGESAESVQQLTEAATPTAVVVEDHPAFKTSLMEPHVIVEPANEVQAIPVSELIAEPIETYNESNSMNQSVEVVNMECKAPELQIDIVPSSNTEAVSPVVEPPSTSLPPPVNLLREELTQPQSECEPEAGPLSPVDNQSSSVKEVPQVKSTSTAKVLVQQRTDSLTSSDGEEGDQPSTEGMSLFGEVIEPTHQDKPADVTSSKEEVGHVVPSNSDVEDLFGGSNRVQAAPVVISDDEDDAFSLFGRPSSSTTSTPSKPRKSVTWGETQAKEIPARKSPPAPLIFGLATAGAYSDSDSDDSDFE